MITLNKKKIINDPVYGFISIRYDIIFDLISHPYLQRLRNIKQCAMTYLVYPGAVHTRFQHIIGAMHLMDLAINTLRNKCVDISTEEAEATNIAILLHDIGHGPFSHALEHCIIDDLYHEDLTLLIMQKLNNEFGGRLSMAIEIFKNIYPKKYLHQLVSGQLDVDRMDYLNRDSFFTGVAEGVINYDRILKMFNVKDNQLVVEEKGVYSIEKFIIARRLMYWQVYLHKTVVSAENILLKILKRAKHLAFNGEELFVTPNFKFFLYNKVTSKSFEADPNCLEKFVRLDDHEIMVCVRYWAEHQDFILSFLCNSLLNRHLYRVEIKANEWSDEDILERQTNVKKELNIGDEDLDYFVFTGTLNNIAYDKHDPIKLLRKDGSQINLTEASDNMNIEALSHNVRKYYLASVKV